MTRLRGCGSERDDRGVAIIWSLALCTVLLLVGTIGAVVAGQAGLRMKAGTVADLAAIAGSQSTDDPCAAAAEVTSANGLVLTTCQRDGPDVIVTIAGDPPEGMQRMLVMLGVPSREVTATSRAGPP